MLARLVALLSAVLLQSALCAAPTIANSGGSNSTQVLTSHTVNVGSPSSGQKIVVIGGCMDDGTTSTNVTITPPTGYASTTIDSLTTGTKRKIVGLYTKTADGSEGASQTFTTNITADCSWIFYNITSGTFDSMQDAEGNGSGFSTTSSPNPPTLTPTGGSKDYLWITYATGRGDFGDYTIPSGYATRLESLSGSSRISLATAIRTNAASSEDAGVWDTGGIDESSAGTVDVPPAASSGSFIVRSKHGRVGGPEVIR